MESLSRQAASQSRLLLIRHALNIKPRGQRKCNSAAEKKGWVGGAEGEGGKGEKKERGGARGRARRNAKDADLR